MYIVFEGLVGSGKSTQSKKLTEYLKQKFPKLEVIYTREPGGTKISEDIRKICQHVDYEVEMESICEAYLYASSRAQSLRQIVKPVLDKGGIVVADRSFLTSLSNQAFGRELGFKLVYKINIPAIEGLLPDKIIYLDIPFEVGTLRTEDHQTDKFEKYGVDFYKRVIDGYKFMSKHKNFKEKWINVDALGTEEEVFKRIIAKLGY